MFYNAKEGRRLCMSHELPCIADDGVGPSPSQLLINRQLRTKLPIISGRLNPKVVESSKPQLVERQAKQKHYYDRRSTILPDMNRDTQYG